MEFFLAFRAQKLFARFPRTRRINDYGSEFLVLLIHRARQSGIAVVTRGHFDFHREFLKTIEKKIRYFSSTVQVGTCDNVFIVAIFYVD